MITFVVLMRINSDGEQYDNYVTSFTEYSEAEEYYSNLDPKDPNYAQAKELFMLLKGMSYAKN